jgi:hypothetical protein
VSVPRRLTDLCRERQMPLTAARGTLGCGMRIDNSSLKAAI